MSVTVTEFIPRCHFTLRLLVIIPGGVEAACQRCLHLSSMIAPEAPESDEVYKCAKNKILLRFPCGPVLSDLVSSEYRIRGIREW